MGTEGSVRFRDRRDAGRQLAERVAALGLDDPVVLALPRGGIPVAIELGFPVDVVVARKIGAPGHPEYGIGAVSEQGGLVLDDRALAALRLRAEDLTHQIEAERQEAARRVRRYRGGRPLPDVAGRAVVLVDDGLATGVTAEATLRGLRTSGPRRLVLAVPVAAPESVVRMSGLADDVVTVLEPPEFRAVGQWYERFEQLTDDEVVALLTVSR